MPMELAHREMQAIREHFDGQVSQARLEFEEQKSEAEKRFGAYYNLKLQKTHKKVFGGALAAAGLYLFGGAILAAVKTAAFIALWGYLLAGLVIAGVVCWRKLPRLELQLANSEKERIESEMNRYIEAKQAEMNRHIEAIEAERVRHIETRKTAVRRNPIEYLERTYMENVAFYEKWKKALVRTGGDIGAHVEKFRRKKKDRPNVDFSAEERAIERMQLWHKNRLDRLNEFYQKSIREKEKLDEARDHWELKLSGVAALAEEDRMRVDMGAMFDEMLVEIAYDQVHREYEEVFARIEVDVREAAARPKLEFSPEMVLNLPVAAPTSVERTPVPVQQS